MPGAVDLSALAQARQVQQQAEEARADLRARADSAEDGALGTTVIDVTDASFETDVISRSMTVPVVIDFWADWCGPCKQLSPVLERMATEDAGAWVLAKVDVDANPQLAAAGQVQSIPTVLVVWQGQAVPGFQGALPEAQVRLFLDEVLALAGRTPGVAGETSDPTLAAAEDALTVGDLAGAAQAYRNILSDRPGDPAATAGLARVDLLERAGASDAEAVRAAADANPSDVAAAMAAADVEVLQDQVEQAFARLIAAVRATSGTQRDAVRDRLIELFAVIGDEDERVLRGRRDLASALF